MNIYSDETSDIRDIDVGDSITLTGNVKDFTVTDGVLVSVEIDSMEVEVKTRNRDYLHPLRKSMDNAEDYMAHQPSRQPIPAP